MSKDILKEAIADAKAVRNSFGKCKNCIRRSI